MMTGEERQLLRVPAVKKGFGQVMLKWRLVPLIVRSDKTSTDDMLTVARYEMSLK